MENQTTTDNETNQNNKLASLQAGSLLEQPHLTGQNDDDDEDVLSELISEWSGAGITEVVFKVVFTCQLSQVKHSF